jgi:hypothetical protein
VSPHLADAIDRQVSSDEARAYLAHPLSHVERESALALIAWFCRRYPTPTERLAYVRRAYDRWTRGGHHGSGAR